MHTIKFDFKVSECNGWPTIVFLVDDDTLLEHQFTQEQETIELPIDVLDGEHLLEIERINVTRDNTQIDQTGHIIKDQLVELLNIYIDNVRLPEFFKYRGTYTLNGQSYPQGLTWGGNGIWSWDFETPIIDWAIDTKIEHANSFKGDHQPNKEKIIQAKEYFNSLRDLLDSIDE